MPSDPFSQTEGSTLVNVLPITLDPVNNLVGIGTTTPTYGLEIVRDGGTHLGLNVTRYGPTASNLFITLAHGSKLAPTQVLINERFVSIHGGTYGTAAFSGAICGIEFFATENQTDSARGCKIIFGTTANGSTSRTERMMIGNDGNVGIGTTAPNANALLDVSSTTKAFMPPRMTTAQKDNLATPTAGMVVYDNTLAKLAVYTSSWETLSNIFYEESSFTPTILGSITAGSANYTGGATGRATKIGRLVTFSLLVSYIDGTGSGNLRVGGLPYTIGYASIFTVYAENITHTASHYIVGSSTAGTTYIGIDQIPTSGTGGGATSVPYDLAGTIRISGSYIV